ncbi:hypothetical protein ACFVJM_24270 [Streptomyces virginiae]|uniref:hypothetical protein n=1 Tax=Streptomyces virginiae TaxID=1961 RepID=UPI00362A2E67
MTKIAGAERAFDAEITEQIPDTKVAWVTVGARSEQSGPATFQPIDPSHTQVTLMMDLDPEAGPSRAVAFRSTRSTTSPLIRTGTSGPPVDLP